MNKLLIRYILLSLILFGFQQQLRAQETPNPISEIEIEQFEAIIDSIHENYAYYNYPTLIKRLVFVSKVAEENKNKALWFTSKFYTADIFYKTGRLSEAQHILEEIFENTSPEIDKVLFPYSYYLYIHVLLGENQVSQARKVYEKAGKLEDGGSEIHSFVENLVYAKLLYKEGKLEEALPIAERVEAKINQFPSSYLLGETYFLEALIFKEQKQLDKAITKTKETYFHAHENNYEMFKLKSSELLTELYRLKNNYAEQIHYLSNSNRIKDSIINFQNQQFTEDKVTEFKSIKSAVDTISKLSLANLEQEKSIKYNQLTIILSALFIGILSLFTVSLYKNNNLRAKANKLLQEKNSELIESREKALAAMHYREQFLSTITHELRTPIYAVTGLTYLLLKENPTPQQEEHLMSLKHSGEHLLSLINNILDINKLESNKLNKVEVDFNLKSKLKNVVEPLKRSAKENGNSLHLELDDKIPTMLKGDIVKLSQILINLISNAIKFTNNGDIWVRVNFINETSSNVLIQFEVEDNGKGIAKENHKNIFEKFNQGSDEGTYGQAGTGLGLPIVKNLLKFLNSDIDLESELGKGSKFFFKVSFEKVQQKSVEVDSVKKIDEESIEEVFVDKKILVVEDNKLNQKITCKILEKKNLKCEIANNGEEAVNLSAKNQYDLILMDIHMPVMDGIEATKVIRKKDKKIPIIALTAVNISEEIKEFLKYGFNDIIPKPYKTELFYEKIYTNLQENPSIGAE